MDSIYENSTFILSTVASNENISHHKGNFSNERKREVNPAKWNKVLLTVFSVSLLFAVGGLCVLGTLYISASMQLSAQENNSTIMETQLEELTASYSKVKNDIHIKDLMVKELTANYSRVKDDLRNKDLMVKELTANNSRVKEQLSFYEGFQGKLYFFSSDKLTWSSSRAFCASRGADLVTITSQSEQEFLHSKIKEWYWIGLNDLETEGRWVWLNKQTLGDTGVQFWHKRQSEKSEPDNWKVDDSSGENCAIVKNDVNSLNSWFDVSCKHTYKFICEKKL